ncbi:AraC family transcriptional regulator [Lachnospiraceae bacterium JLR.KK008]
MINTSSDRVLVTPSPYAKEHYLYVQEIGTLQSLHPHISKRQNLSSLLFFIVTSGQGTLTYRERTWQLHQGDCAWVDCALPYSHESSVSSPWELKWVHFYGKDAPEFYSQFLLQNSPCVFTPGNPAVFNGCLSALLELYKKNDPYRELLSHKYLTQLCTTCFPESKKRLSDAHSVQSKLIQIREYIFSHYAEKISLDELSQIFFISKYYLVREYRKCFGTTPGNDLMACRISHAKSLLRFDTQKNIEEISVLCGFHSPAYFIRMFRRAENMTPLEYRRKW